MHVELNTSPGWGVLHPSPLQPRVCWASEALCDATSFVFVKGVRGGAQTGQAADGARILKTPT